MVAFMLRLSCLLASCFLAMSCGGNSPLGQTSVSGDLTNQMSEATETTPNVVEITLNAMD